MNRTAGIVLTLAAALGGCDRGTAQPAQAQAAQAQAVPSGAAPARTAGGFPAAERPVSPIVSARWQNEDMRDRAGEADAVLRLGDVRPGMAVADIGAGEGYYTLKLARTLGPRGHVFAEDIMPDYVAALRKRVAAAGARNVTVTLGAADDPRLPSASVDRVLMVHMYHEIAAPYAFLWRLRPALRPGGRVLIVDADRPTGSHGTPPALLDCELAAVGYRRVARAAVPDGYLASYVAEGPRPEPGAIKACGNPAG